MNIFHRETLCSAFLGAAPKHPECALPPSEDAVTGATVPPMEFGIPQGNVEPFWVTLRSDPFLFLTRSPWFIFPSERATLWPVDFCALNETFPSTKPIQHCICLCSFLFPRIPDSPNTEWYCGKLNNFSTFWLIKVSYCNRYWPNPS